MCGSAHVGTADRCCCWGGVVSCGSPILLHSLFRSEVLQLHQFSSADSVTGGLVFRVQNFSGKLCKQRKRQGVDRVSR